MRKNFALLGNITDKSDAGTYSYLATKPNAVSAVTNPTTVIPLQEQLVSYTAFMQPQTITENNYELTYTYGADYERIKGILKQNNALLRTRYYTGAGYEKDLVNGGATREIHYIDSPAGLIAIVVRENGSDAYHYVYTDHLGSILTVTDAGGSIEAEQNFDAWGRRRNTTDWSYYSVGAAPDWLYRGYTGHEMLDPFVLINMNGRIYDPVVGRVLSPDNFVIGALSTQGFNRYSYALNNPLKYSDPDGNCPVCIAFIVGFASGLISHAIQGTVPDNIWEALKPGLTAAATAAIAPLASAASEFAVGLLPEATSPVIKTLLAQGLSWGLSGGVGAGLNGASVLGGFTSSALQGIGLSALGQGIKGLRALKASTEDVLGAVDLPEVNVRVARNSRIGQALLRNQAEMSSILYGADAYHPWTFEGFSLSANFDASAFAMRGNLQVGVAFGPRDVGIYTGAGGSLGLSTELPSIGGGINFNFHDTYGNVDVLDGLGGTDMGYGATVGPVSVGYSSSAVRAPRGYFIPAPIAGVNTYSFGAGGGFGINHGISQSGIWRLSSLFNRK